MDLCCGWTSFPHPPTPPHGCDSSLIITLCGRGSAWVGASSAERTQRKPQAWPSWQVPSGRAGGQAGRDPRPGEPLSVSTSPTKNPNPGSPGPPNPECKTHRAETPKSAPAHSMWHLLRREAAPPCWYRAGVGVTTAALSSRPVFMESGEVGMNRVLVCGQVQDFSRGGRCSS